jgi:hypothetical protein
VTNRPGLRRGDHDTMITKTIMQTIDLAVDALAITLRIEAG